MFDIEFCNEGPVFDMCGNEINMSTSEFNLIDFHFHISPNSIGLFTFQIIANHLFLDKEQKEHYVFWEEGHLTLEQIKNDIEQVLEKKELFI